MIYAKYFKHLFFQDVINKVFYLINNNRIRLLQQQKLSLYYNMWTTFFSVSHFFYNA